MRIALSAGTICCLILSACDGSAKSSPPSNGRIPETSTAGSAGPSAKGDGGKAPSCPRTGLWALCSVEKRLQRAGFVLKVAPGRPQRRAGFSVLPTAYVLNRSRLEVFVYPDASALDRDLAKIDTLTASPVGAVSQWRTPIAWVRSGNLAAVFITDNATQADRLTLALTAGAPQP
jgi:hypothetical protein